MKVNIAKLIALMLGTFAMFVVAFVLAFWGSKNYVIGIICGSLAAATLVVFGSGWMAQKRY